MPSPAGPMVSVLLLLLELFLLLLVARDNNAGRDPSHILWGGGGCVCMYVWMCVSNNIIRYMFYCRTNVGTLCLVYYLIQLFNVVTTYTRLANGTENCRMVRVRIIYYCHCQACLLSRIGENLRSMWLYMYVCTVYKAGISPKYCRVII